MARKLRMRWTKECLRLCSRPSLVSFFVQRLIVEALSRVGFAILRLEMRPGLARPPRVSLPLIPFSTPNGALRVWAGPVDPAASAEDVPVGLACDQVCVRSSLGSGFK